MPNKYARILFDTFKEKKTAVLATLNKALNALMENEMINVDTMINIALTLDPHKNIISKGIFITNINI